MLRASTLKASLNLQHSGFSLQAELDMPATGITAVFGRSGSGKTTLLRCLAGLENNAGGYVQFGSQHSNCFWFVCFQISFTFAAV